MTEGFYRAYANSPWALGGDAKKHSSNRFSKLCYSKQIMDRYIIWFYNAVGKRWGMFQKSFKEADVIDLDFKELNNEEKGNLILIVFEKSKNHIEFKDNL